MRLSFVVSSACAVLLLASGPANADWHSYVSRDGGFSFSAPGEISTETTSYPSASAGARPTTVFRSAEDNIEYRVMVIDFTGVTMPEADLIKEASTAFQEKTKVLADSEARVEANYGRKMTVDLPDNRGRSMAGVYFTKGRLIRLDVTVLPANGDYGTPDMGRFVDSIAFGPGREEADATELKLQK